MAERFWNQQNTARLLELAAARVPASEIASELGATALSVTGKCAQLGVPVVKRSATEEVEYRDRKRVTERNRMRVKRARRRAKAQTVPAARPQTAPRGTTFRRAPTVPQLSKSQLRAELAQAIRNTAAMPVE